MNLRSLALVTILGSFTAMAIAEPMPQMPAPSGWPAPSTATPPAPSPATPWPTPNLPATAPSTAPMMPSPYGAMPSVSAPTAPVPQGKPLSVAVPSNVYAELKNGKPKGVIIETLDSIAKELGYAPRYVIMAGSEAREGMTKGDIAVSTGVLVKATSDSNFYSDSIVREFNIILVRKGEKTDIESLKDLTGKSIGGRVGFKYPLLEKASGIDLIRNRKDGENIRKLLLKELDAVVVGSVSDIYEFRAEGVMHELSMLDKAVGYVDLGVAFSRKSVDQTFVDRFNARLAEFKTSKEWTAILERNGVEDLVKDIELVK